MSKGARLSVALALFAAAVGLVVFTSMAFLRSNPPTVDFTSGHQAGQPLDLNIETVGTIGFGTHPTWVSYLVKAPNGQWVHTTIWRLPAHTRINVTLDQYDSGSPLRNPQIGGITGTFGGVMNLNGQNVSLVDATQGNGVGHTFSVPALGLNVPLVGVDGSAKNFCSSGPCYPSSAHNTIKFTFLTPGPGSYRWQCFVPCGLGYLYGNGGPMQTVGFMGGFLEVAN